MICNTAFLKEQCDYDEEMVETMINMFVSTAPDYLKKMNDAHESRNFSELKNAAHGFLSSLKIMGATKVVTLTQKIEADVMNDSFDQLETLLSQVNELTNMAIEELNEETKK